MHLAHCDLLCRPHILYYSIQWVPFVFILTQFALEIINCCKTDTGQASIFALIEHCNDCQVLTYSWQVIELLLLIYIICKYIEKISFSHSLHIIEQLLLIHHLQTCIQKSCCSSILCNQLIWTTFLASNTKISVLQVMKIMVTTNTGNTTVIVNKFLEVI